MKGSAAGTTTIIAAVTTTMLELTTLSSAGPATVKGKTKAAYSYVPFKDKFMLDGSKEIATWSKGERQSKRGAYLGIGKPGEKLLWIKYRDILYDALKSWPKEFGGCHIAESATEGKKYIILILPQDCRIEGVRNSVGNQWAVSRRVWAPINVIDALRRRLNDSLFHHGIAPEYVLPEEIKFGTYFMIFDDLWTREVQCPYCSGTVQITHNGAAPATPISPDRCPHCKAGIVRYQSDIFLPPASEAGNSSSKKKEAEIKFESGKTMYVIFEKPDEEG